MLETTAPESSFQNGRAERQHHTLAAMMKTMLLGAGLTSSFWSDALPHAVYLKNRLAHQSLPNHIAPFKAWTGQRPDLSHLRVFRSIVCAKRLGIR